MVDVRVPRDGLLTGEAAASELGTDEGTFVEPGSTDEVPLEVSVA